MGSLKSYFTLSGRLTPLQYWRFQVRLGLAGAVLITVTTIATMAGGWLGAIPFAFVFPLLAAGLSVAIRRLHDRGKSAWWLLLFLGAPGALAAMAEPLIRSDETAAIAGLLMLPALALMAWFWIEVALLRGQKGANRFGPGARSI
jgi:uncharacterized membrane protein YhaH (DUF805 family)